MRNFITKGTYLVCAVAGTTLLISGAMFWIIADAAQSFYREENV